MYIFSKSPDLNILLEIPKMLIIYAHRHIHIGVCVCVCVKSLFISTQYSYGLNKLGHITIKTNQL